MNDKIPSKYWLDQVAETIIQQFPEGEIVVSSGHSPSGTYHVGTMREIITASAITWALQQRQRQAQHLDFVDDFDILRKLPADMPAKLRAELGKPLYLANGPDKGVTYADNRLADLFAAEKQIGFEPDQTLRASTTYVKEHRYTDAITKALDKLTDVREIIERVSQRQLPVDWAPVQILSDDGLLNQWSYSGHDTANQSISYRDKAGKTGEISYAEGRVKLDWRLDWPARWWMWQVRVEPFGRDHASKGGSYDTGKALVEEIFGGQAPFPVPYEFINSPGATKKMSKSSGGVLTPLDAIEVMPAEVLRYFMVRSRPTKQLIFDPGIGLYNLVDEFAAAESAVTSDQLHEFADAYRFAIAAGGNAKQSMRTISSVPFKHLVSVYQAAQNDVAETLAILSRTGYEGAVNGQREVILSELKFVKTWLANYAPDEVKFEVQAKLPKVELSQNQQHFLGDLAATITKQSGEIDGQAMHVLIYAAKDATELTPIQAFQAIYRVILGQDSGPKAGWFLANLDRDWLVARLLRTA